VPDPSHLRYAASHEWYDPASGRVGITDHAQAQLGDVIFLDLPAVGRALEAGKTFGVIESVKAASDLYAPVSGVVAEINPSIAGGPEQVNSDPYGEGWLIRIEGGEDSGLLDAEAYGKLTGD
jgi:glycine cleavage system H protein